MEFQKIVNARDLGGLKVGNKTIRKGLLLRSGSLNEASDEDVRLLVEKYHLRRIFDFRTEAEAALQPDRKIPGAEHIFLPTLDPEMEKRSGDAVPAQVFLNLQEYIVRLSFNHVFQEKGRMLYPSLVRSEFSQLQYAAFLNLTLEAPEGAVLWHCSQGKDRTGIGAALILAALGANRETIVRDFDRSNDSYRPLVEKLCADVKAAGGGEDEMDVVRAFMGVSVKNFNHALDIIEERWGSLQNYLQQQMEIGPDECRRLQERYLV